jgi:hypothetical protein
MSMNLAPPPPILAAAERLRQAEARVETLRAVVAQFAGPSPARDLACRELAVCERSLFNRRLELADLQRERRLQDPRRH